jgi:hypothetical protein
MRRRPRDHTRFPGTRRLAVRLHELTRLLLHRHGRGLNTDDADIILVPIARILFYRYASWRVASDENLTAELMAYCKQYAPLIPRETVVSMAVEAMARPELENKFTLGLRVRLTNAERDQLHIGTFRPFDLSPRQFEQARQQKRRDQDRIRKAAQRRKEGRRARALWLAESLTRTAPWLADGICRRTWERRRRKAQMGVAGVSATNLSIGKRQICDTAAKKQTSETRPIHQHHHPKRMQRMGEGRRESS